MSERVKVEPSEIKVGDLIEVDYVAPYYADDEGMIYRGLVTSTTAAIQTKSFAFGKDEGYTFYRLPKPAPQEPKGLGAVVQVRQADYPRELWVRTVEEGYPWYHDGDTQTWEAVIEEADEIKVLSDGYAE